MTIIKKFEGLITWSTDYEAYEVWVYLIRKVRNVEKIGILVEVSKQDFIEINGYLKLDSGYYLKINKCAVKVKSDMTLLISGNMILLKEGI
jgi:hypothetical protein